MAGFNFNPAGMLQTILDPQQPLSNLKNYFGLTEHPDGTKDFRIMFMSAIRFFHVWELYWAWRTAKEDSFEQGYHLSSIAFIIEYIRIECARVRSVKSTKYKVLYVLSFIDSIFYTFYSMVLQWLFVFLFVTGFLIVAINVLATLVFQIYSSSLPIDWFYYFGEHLKFVIYVYIVWFYVALFYYVCIYPLWKPFYRDFEERDREIFRAKYMKAYNTQYEKDEETKSGS